MALGRCGRIAEKAMVGAALNVKQPNIGGKQMKRLNYMLAVAGVGVAMLLSAASASAQPQDNNPPPGGPGGGGRGRGNFDPEQMRQRMLERAKEQLEVTKDDEWKALEPLVTKVMEARRDAMTGGMRGFFGRGPRGGDQGNR